MSDELACELAFDRVAAHLADPSATAPPPARVREVIRRAEGFAALAPRVRAEVQRQALGWLERFPAVLLARRAVPSRAAYEALRRALESSAVEAFGAPWLALARWCAGVPPAASEPWLAKANEPATEDRPTTTAAMGRSRQSWAHLSVQVSKQSVSYLSKHGPAGASAPSPIDSSVNLLMDSSMSSLMDAPMGSSKSLLTSSSTSSSTGSRKDSPRAPGQCSSSDRDAASGAAPKDWIDQLWPIARWPLPLVERTAQRPRTWRRAGKLVVEVRAEPGTPQGAFELAHELGHAAAALASPGPLPRAVDEAVAALVARQLEEHPACAAPQRALRARRHELAQRLACIEADLSSLDELVPGSSLPWALWHDPGAQRAYLRAEELASTWWDQGLRWQPPWLHACVALTAAVAQAVDEARALPAPWP